MRLLAFALAALQAGASHGAPAPVSKATVTIRAYVGVRLQVRQAAPIPTSLAGYCIRTNSALRAYSVRVQRAEGGPAASAAWTPPYGVGAVPLNADAPREFTSIEALTCNPEQAARLSVNNGKERAGQLLLIIGPL